MIVGLGNPGPRYKQTLHNVGFKVVEKLAARHEWSWKFEDRFDAEVTRGKLGEMTYHLLKPETFMNLSGEAVQEYLRYFGFHPSQLIAVLDDADLPTGELRLRPFGGSGGHNGLKSLAQELSTGEFKRLRFGIGRPKSGIDLADYVLMHQEESLWEQLDPALERAASVLESLANETFENVMKAAHTKAANGEKDETRNTQPL